MLHCPGGQQREQEMIATGSVSRHIRATVPSKLVGGYCSLTEEV
jgi:hypothetical protein